MINYSNSKEKVLTAYKLLQEDSTTKEKFESIKTLLNGVNPKIDQALERVLKAWSDLEKIQHGEVIELSVEHLPEETEKEKKRKRLLLLLIRSWNDLKSEVKRIRAELETNRTDGKESFSKIATFAKGPFGFFTLAAVLIVVGSAIFLNLNKNQTNNAPATNTETTTPEKPKIKVIEFEGKKIPLTELTVGVGPECDQESHYHAKDHSLAKALDGSLVSDPGGCGYGKVKEVEILEK